MVRPSKYTLENMIIGLFLLPDVWPNQLENARFSKLTSRLAQATTSEIT